jgi:hypothetical protein
MQRYRSLTVMVPGRPLEHVRLDELPDEPVVVAGGAVKIRPETKAERMRRLAELSSYVGKRR